MFFLLVFGLYRLLHWVTISTILCCVQTGEGCRTKRSDLHCWSYRTNHWILFFLSNSRRTITAVERWLHMSRRSLLTVRRVVTLQVTFALILIVFFASVIYFWYYTTKFLKLFITVFVFGAILCIFITQVFAYFKVFRIIRQHQSQIQTNQNVIDIEKYKKSVFTILYILMMFLLSYVPYVCGLLVVTILDYFGITLSP